MTLQRTIDAAIARGASQLTLQPPSAEYDCTAASLVIMDGVDLEIDGLGATLWFAPGTGLSVKNCTRVRVQNVALDYTPTLAQGVVTSVDAARHSFVAKFDADFLRVDQLGPPHFPGDGQVKVAFFSNATRRMLRNASLDAAINIFAATSETALVDPSANTWRVNVTGNLNAFQYAVAVGLPVLVFPRGGSHSLVVSQSAHCVFTDVRIYGGGSMGIVDAGGVGGNTYRRVVLDRRPLRRGRDMELLASPLFRYLASNADGIHSTSNNDAPTLVDSTISWTGDDLANICSAMSVTLVPVGEEALAFVDIGGNLATAQRGDVMSFYHLTTMVFQGSATIASVEVGSADPTALAAMRAGYAAMQAPPYSAHFVSEPEHFFVTGSPVAITFQGSRPAFAQKYWSLAVLEATDNSNALVQNTTLSDGYARAFMVKGRDSTFVNNTFRRAGGIWIGPEQAWLEGDPGIRNVTIENNVFDAIGDTPVEYNCNTTGRGFVVRNNTVTRSY